MLYNLLIGVHILICIVLALVVLLQSSKGGGLAGAFGGAGGAPQQLLGSRGMTTLLHKLTIYLAVAFFLSSFSLFMMEPGVVRPGGSSVVEEAAREGQINVPLQEDPLEIPAEAPVETPAPSGGEGTEETESGEGGGN
jgi:preprotein translocase subunit SecG